MAQRRFSKKPAAAKADSPAGARVVGVQLTEGQITRLEKAGRIVCDADTSEWHLAEAASLKGAAG